MTRGRTGWTVLLLLGAWLGLAGCAATSVQLSTEPEVKVARTPRLAVLPFWSHPEVSDPQAAERLRHGLAEFLRSRGGYTVVELSVAQLGPADVAAMYLDSDAALRVARKADAAAIVGGYVASDATEPGPEKGGPRHVVAAGIKVFDAIVPKTLVLRDETVTLPATPKTPLAAVENEMVQRLGRSFVTTRVTLHIPPQTVFTASEFADGKPIQPKGVFAAKDPVVAVVVALPPEYDHARISVRVTRSGYSIRRASLLWDDTKPFQCVRLRPAELLIRYDAGEFRVEAYIGETRIGRTYFEVLPEPGFPTHESLQVPELNGEMGEE